MGQFARRRLLSLGLTALMALSGCAPAASPTATTAARPAAATAAPAATSPPAAAPTGAAARPTADSAAAAADRVWSIGIFQLTSHPALDACANGIVKALADNGFAEGKNDKIDRQNAQGDIPTLTTIAQKFVDAKVDLIVADSTPALLAAAKVTQGKESPAVVFDCVSDPYKAAPVARSATDKPANMTGIQALAPVEEALQLVKE